MDKVALDDDVEELGVCVALVGVDKTVTVAVAGAMVPAGLAVELDTPRSLGMNGQPRLERDFVYALHSLASVCVDNPTSTPNAQ